MFWTRGSVDDWTLEMVGQKFIFEEFAKIPSKDIAGTRSPHLRVGSNSQVILLGYFLKIFLLELLNSEFFN
jgi:hypothetical protein